MPRPKKPCAEPGEKSARPTVPGKIVATCEGAFTLYVNGEQILADGNQVATKELPLAIGDLVTVESKGQGAGAAGLLLRDRLRQDADHHRAGLARPPAGVNRRVVPAQERRQILSRGARAAAERQRSKAPPHRLLERTVGGKPPAIWGQGDTCYLMTVIR